MTELKFRRSPDALHSDIGEDVVALQVQRGHCFGMERVTADVWRLLEQEPSLGELCDRLMEVYEVDAGTCRTEVSRLLNIMQQEGLVETVS